VKWRLGLFSLLCAGVLAAAGCGRYATSDAAIVDGHRISKVALDRKVEELKAQQNQQQQQQQQAGDAGLVDLQRRALLELVQQVLLGEEFATGKISVSDRDVDSRLTQVASQFPSQAAFIQALEQQGLTMASFRERIRNRLGLDRLEAKVITVSVTEAELRRGFAERRNEFEQARARHILFSTGTARQTLKKAQDALARLRAGADFAVLAKQLSEDGTSRENGGDLGLQPRGTFVPEFDRVVWSLALHTVSAPVKTEFGHHLIEVMERRVTSFAQARDRLRSQLEQQKRDDAFQTYLQGVVAKASIEINPRYGTLDVGAFQIVDVPFFSSPSPPAARAARSS
jgi:parvulin-like peptidyl-prolyl isomerase